MEPVRVPQHLELEDVLAWGLTATDLLHLALGSLAAWWLYLVVPAPTPIRIAIAALVALPAGVLGLGRLGERPLRSWLMIIADYLRRPRRRLYRGEA